MQQPINVPCPLSLPLSKNQFYKVAVSVTLEGKVIETIQRILLLIFKTSIKYKYKNRFNMCKGHGLRPLSFVWQHLLYLVLTHYQKPSHLDCVDQCYSKCGPWSRSISSASLGKLWEVQIWGPFPRPIESEFLGMESKNLWFNKPSSLKFWVLLM